MKILVALWVLLSTPPVVFRLADDTDYLHMEVKFERVAEAGTHLIFTAEQGERYDLYTDTPSLKVECGKLLGGE